MDPNTQTLLRGSTVEDVYIEDTFSTWLYTGTGATQTITNGINLSGIGGLVWSKQRNGTADHYLIDSQRFPNELYSNLAVGQANGGRISSLDSTGYTLSTNAALNQNLFGYVSWTFRVAPKFFDVVTWTGTGVARSIPHSLGSAPGLIIVKRTDGSGNWQCWHRSISTGTVSSNTLTVLNSSAGSATALDAIGTASSTSFEVGSNTIANGNGSTYVAYLFAHDAGGFGDSGGDNVVSCGSYTGNGSTTGPVITLGWEPQWLLVKRTDTTGDWHILDNMRGLVVGGADSEINPNSTTSETSGTFITPLPNGFQLNTVDAGYNASAGTYIYVAIRRGPMRTPTDATKVFQAKLYTGNSSDNRLVTTDIVTDMAWVRQRDDVVLGGLVVGDRLRGQPYILTGSSTTSELDDADSFDQQVISTIEYGNAWSSMTGFWVGNDVTSKLNANTAANNHLALAFRRAPGFFDMVGYAGTGSVRTVSHNLGVVPELMIVRARNSNTVWCIYSLPTQNTHSLRFSNAARALDGTAWNNTSPTSTNFTVGTAAYTNGAFNYIAYLFASCPGVSKVGSYIGTGTTLNVDCGFTNGARLVLIKRTDSTGDWHVWDTARGIVAANDPFLLLSNTTADNTTTDYIDPLSSGFQISSTAPAAINASGGSYLYLAIA